MLQLSYSAGRGCEASNDEPVSSSRLIKVPAQEKSEQHFCILIADHIVEINSLYKEVYSLCGKFFCNLEPEIHISINERDLDFEKEENLNNGIFEREGYLETLAVYRKISEEMLSFNTFLMHGAVIAFKGNAYMFSAKSGIGKTTHIKKWIDNLENVVVVNGDKPLIQITDKQAIACGTPWCGKEQWCTNVMVPLRSIVLMERGEQNIIEEVSFDRVFSSLLRQTYWPEDLEKRKKTLTLFSKLNSRVHFFRFIFDNLKEDAFDVAYKALVEDEES